MAREISGSIDGTGLRVGLIVAQFNEAITSRLLDGARDALTKHGVREDAITIVTVPGSLELPQVAQRMAQTGDWDALVTLGCVIKGETAHFEYVSGESARGVADVARALDIPIMFGVLTTYDTAQAMARSGGDMGNRGFDCALAAIKMANLYKQLDQVSEPATAKS
jgi:6,7-dimethyl-8-ribityllumazine synthase